MANLQLARSGIRFVPIPITADAELHLFGEILSRKLDELEKLVEEADTSLTNSPTDIKISGEKNERSAHRIEQIRKSISRKYF